MTSESLKSGWQNRIPAACLLLLILTGCSAVSTVSRKAGKVGEILTFSGSNLKKTVAVLPLENHTFFGKNFLAENLEKRFMENLRDECPDCIFIMARDPAFPPQLSGLPKNISGDPDNMALAGIASEAGLNAVVRLSLRDADTEEKEKGVLIFRDSHYYGKIRMNIAVYDTGTGAKLLDESIRRKTEVDGAEFDAIKARNTAGVYEMNTLLEDMAAECGAKICTAIRKQPWQAYVLAVEGKNIRLSCGRESGIRVGDRLDVFERGEIIGGKSGQRFYIPGKKSGELTVREIFVGKTLGELTGGDANAKPASFVRLK